MAVDRSSESARWLCFGGRHSLRLLLRQQHINLRQQPRTGACAASGIARLDSHRIENAAELAAADARQQFRATSLDALEDGWMQRVAIGGLELGRAASAAGPRDAPVVEHTAGQAAGTQQIRQRLRRFGIALERAILKIGAEVGQIDRFTQAPGIVRTLRKVGT